MVYALFYTGQDSLCTEWILRLVFTIANTDTFLEKNSATEFSNEKQNTPLSTNLSLHAVTTFC